MMTGGGGALGGGEAGGGAACTGGAGGGDDCAWAAAALIHISAIKIAALRIAVPTLPRGVHIIRAGQREGLRAASLPP